MSLYQDDLIEIIASPKPVAVGHIQVKTQQSNEETLKRLALGSSQVAVGLFELVKAQGTNIIISDDGKHLSANVVARKENDGLNFMWQPKQGNPDEIAATAKSIKDKIDILKWKKDNPNSVDTTQPKEAESIKASDDKPNYLLKSARRSP